MDSYKGLTVVAKGIRIIPKQTASSDRPSSHGLTVPGDKSISHRALILGALATGVTEITGLLKSADVDSTAQCLLDLGVRIERESSLIRVHGIAGRFQAKDQMKPVVLDCGNSGTTMRLLMGVLSASVGRFTLVGDASLSGRPMARVSGLLSQMGANIGLSPTGTAPVDIVGCDLVGVEHSLKIASAQIKSAVLIAGCLAKGTTHIRGLIQTRDHTERLLEAFGVRLERSPESMSVAGPQLLKGTPVGVPGDLSSAAYLIAITVLTPGAYLKLQGVSLNPTRLGFIYALKKMGASIQMNIEHLHPEPIGSIEIQHSELSGIEIRESEVPSLIDEIPLLSVVATQAVGTTRIHGVSELRVKETDRLKAIEDNLAAMGAVVLVSESSGSHSLSIQGRQPLHGAVLPSFNDHRIAMAFSVAALVAQGETLIEDSECVLISYPGFFKQLGLWVNCEELKS